MNPAVDALLDLLFPPKCVFCRRLLHTGERDLCAACQRALPWLTGAEAEQVGEGFSLCVSPLRYQDTVRDALRRYKFQGFRWYHRVFGKLLAQCIRYHLEGKYDVITWAPLSPNGSGSGGTTRRTCWRTPPPGPWGPAHSPCCGRSGTPPRSPAWRRTPSAGATYRGFTRYRIPPPRLENVFW